MPTRSSPAIRCGLSSTVRERTLSIVGVAISPEFIFQIREGDVLPDDKRFGVLWMGQTDLAAAFDMQGAFNNLAVSVSSAANQREIIRQIDLILEPYGCLGPTTAMTTARTVTFETKWPSSAVWPAWGRRSSCRSRRSC